jgi:hypothetical protein
VATPYTFKRGRSMKPQADVEIEGVNYTLVVDLWAIKVWKDETGKDLLAGDVPTGVEDIIAFFYAALRFKHPEITLEDVGHLIDPGNMGDVMDALTVLTNDSMPEGDGSEVKN